MRNVYKILVGKPGENTSLQRCRRETNPKEISCDDVDFIHLAQDRNQFRALVNTVMNLRVS
jgi:hypothetical protein